ncbi:PREDICTED: protein phosphatase 1 regulatory subunit 3B-like [Priapulus caudatus]|uniref:Protein phosphatase 1 regulatory subunit 3B-like n=1 Tax=Priapulus caudatus TaxID=37621 RepID=A0ABM1EE40_PRICU|nr:PREDICTED: protein phosphatase 1 regulatory subunit 3B-like [Priapulus caudatus]
MPVNCGLLSASPPLFSNMNGMSPSVTELLPRSHSFTFSWKNTMVASFTRSPTRSCLSPEGSSSSGGCVRRKGHRVQFADEKGYALYTVRVMREPSRCPPRLDDDVIARVLADASDTARADDPWMLDFRQPAADYVAFRQRLADDNVALENVILRDSSLTGTVKVRDLAFEKQVGVRTTFDRWRSHVDVPASHVVGGRVSMKGVGFETFSFTANIPAGTEAAGADARVEFCVYFRCDGSEHWDSNGGRNYVVVPRHGGGGAGAPPMPVALPKSPHTDGLLNASDSYTEFAVWNASDTATPYW